MTTKTCGSVCKQNLEIRRIRSQQNVFYTYDDRSSDKVLDNYFGSIRDCSNGSNDIEDKVKSRYMAL